MKGGTAPITARFVGYRARDLVVFVEVGLAVVLLVVAAMWLTFFAEMQRVTPLFPADQVVAVRIPGHEVGAAVERIASLSGVAGVAVASNLPGGRSPQPSPRCMRSGGRTARVAVVEAGPSFFQTLGLPDSSRSIVRCGGNQCPCRRRHCQPSAAASLWAAEDPLGARLTITRRTGTTSAIVIGVCRDAFNLGSLMRSGLAPPDIYIPFDTEGTGDAIILSRAETDAHALVRPIGQAVRTSRSAAVPRVSVIGDNATFVPPDSLFLIRLIGAFGLVALLLAGTGIFGVVSQSVAQRTTEFGVRMAMGASSGQVLRMVLAREAKLIVLAVGVGAIATVGVTRAAFAELVTMSATDPRLWVAAMVLCGGFAAVAVALATYRIVRLDPWVVLRGG